MLKTLPKFCAFIVLCVLLVYMPEIYSTVAPRYIITVPERQLLRIALCTQDDASSSAFFRALNIYMKEHPSIHLRINRVNRSELFSLADPPPDLLVFSSSIHFDSSIFISPSDADSSTSVLLIPDGEPLLCGALRAGNHPDHALAVVDYLVSFLHPDNSISANAEAQ